MLLWRTCLSILPYPRIKYRTYYIVVIVMNEPIHQLHLCYMRYCPDLNHSFFKYDSASPFSSVIGARIFSALIFSPDTYSLT